MLTQCFADIVTSENFLTWSLGYLFANLRESDDADIRKRATGFERHLKERFGMEFTDPYA